MDPATTTPPPADAGAAPDDQPMSSSRHRGRSVISWVLVVIGSILVPLAVTAFWGQRTITDAERYIETVGPLAAEEAIQTAIVDRTTNTLVNTIEQNQGVDQVLEGLPAPVVEKLRAPIEGAIESLVRQVTTRVVGSEQFQDLWIGINRELQKQLVDALSGKRDGAVAVQDEELVLDTGRVIEAVQQELVDRGVTSLADRPIPDGADRQIVLMSAEELKQAQTIYQITVPATRLLLPLVAGIFLAAVAISIRRARTVFGIGIGVLVSMGLLALGLIFARGQIETAAPTTIAQNAINAFWTTLTNYLAISTTTWLTGGAIVALLGWFGGRSRPAAALRASISGSLRRAGGQLANAPFGQFFAEHWRAAFIGIAAMAVAVMMVFFDPITAPVLIGVTVVSLALAALVLIAGAADGSDQQSPTDVSTTA
jgi:hypothetical protein